MLLYTKAIRHTAQTEKYNKKAKTTKMKAEHVRWNQFFAFCSKLRPETKGRQEFIYTKLLTLQRASEK